MALPTNSMLEPVSNRDLWNIQKLLCCPTPHCICFTVDAPFSSCEDTWKTQTLLFKVPCGRKNKTKENRNKQTNKIPSCLFWLQDREQNDTSRGKGRVVILEFKAIKLTSFPLSLEQTLKFCLHLQTGLSRGPFGGCCC